MPLQNGLRLVDKSVVEAFAQASGMPLTDLVFPRQPAGRITLAAEARLAALHLTSLGAPVVP